MSTVLNLPLILHSLYIIIQLKRKIYSTALIYIGSKNYSYIPFISNSRSYIKEILIDQYISWRFKQNMPFKLENFTSSSSVAQQPYVGPGLPQNPPPFLSVQCYTPSIPYS